MLLHIISENGCKFTIDKQYRLSLMHQKFQDFNHNVTYFTLYITYYTVLHIKSHAEPNVCMAFYI